MKKKVKENLLTDKLGNCPECKTKKSRIVWGYHGVYYDMRCENGYSWKYEFGKNAV